MRGAGDVHRSLRDTLPHFTTIADFISTAVAVIATVFGAVLSVCDRQGLIGRGMFVIDGVKLPSNASKRRSGMRSELAARATKLKAAAQTKLARHRAEDTHPVEPAQRTRETQQLAALEHDATHLRAWLAV